MAVGFHNGTSNNNASTAATSASFNAPASPTAGEIWICTAMFRGGSTAAITGVPASFHLIQRTDSGSGATNVTMVTYWYLAVGGEGAGFATITIPSSKYCTITEAFTGCNPTTPVVAASVQSSGAVATTTSVTSAAYSAGQGFYAVGAQQGTADSAAITGSGTSVLTQPSATGGSAATNVGGADHTNVTNTTSGGVSFSVAAKTGTASTVAIQTFTLDVASTPPVQLLPHPAFIYLRDNR